MQMIRTYEEQAGSAWEGERLAVPDGPREPERAFVVVLWPISRWSGL